MKNAFDRLISSLDTKEERISEVEDMTTETSKTEKQREKWLKKKKAKQNRTECLRIWDNYKMYNICVMGIPNIEERNRIIFEATMMENFPQINHRHQTTDAGSSENTKQDKCKIKQNFLGITYSKFRKLMIKKISEKVRRKKSPYL